MIRLVLDEREPSEFLQPLQELGFPVSVDRLAAGDLWALDGEQIFLAVERKDPADLLNSIADGRLFRQVAELIELGGLPVLLIHGRMEWEDGFVRLEGRTGWRYASVAMALLRAQLAGCPVLYWPDRFQDAIRLLIQRALRPSRGFPLARRPLKPMDERIWFLSQLPGIGPVRAQELLERWGSVEKALEAARRSPAIERFLSTS